MTRWARFWRRLTRPAGVLAPHPPNRAARRDNVDAYLGARLGRAPEPRARPGR